MKTISIFGSTGSIGKNTIQVILNSPKSYKIIALAAKSDVKTLIEQAKLLQPKYVVIADEKLFGELKSGLKDFSKIKVLSGLDALNEVAQIKCDLFLSAIVGMAALMPTINAIQAGSNIGLANKECLVSAGDIILKEAKKHKVKLIPIDSEHNAIFQIFEHEHLDLIENIVLTASGGPFFKYSLSEMKNITKEQAIKHPNWKMGAKISVDSATMMNKGLEMIEAYRLFPLAKNQIEVVIHPESIIHGLVNYADGSTLAMMSLPDMKTPISYALGYPKRIPIKHPKLDLAKIASLNFFAPDDKKFPALKLAREAMEAGGNAPCILNAANEIAVEKFLQEKIKFNDIVKIVVEVLSSISYSKLSSLEDVLNCDNQARKLAREIK